MLDRVVLTLAFLLFFPHGCSDASTPTPVSLKYGATGKTPEVLAVYEAWFGQPNHISVGYSSDDPEVIKHQIDKAKSMGISAFVVDWYGNRDPLIDQSYGRMQALAAKHKFHVAMMYDEKNAEVGATDQAIAELTKFNNTYLSAGAAGRDAYLTYEGRPVIFIFPSGNQTNWDEVRAAVNRWTPAPLLIQENLPAKYAADFDGFYPWPNPGPKGWAADGSNWGYDYLMQFYTTMTTKFPDKIIVGGAWPQFDDSKASWGLNRHIAPRCGQTFWDTFGFWRQFVQPGQAIPFVLVETWNDYEEGTALEPGVPTCDGKPEHKNLQKMEKKEPSAQPQPQ